jgi:membrane peptidoglycan carboxypeptidase
MNDWKVRLHFNNPTGAHAQNRLKEFRAIREAHVRAFKWFHWMLILAIILVPIIYEMRTSAVQSWVLSRYARKMSYKVEPGPSPSIIFPKHGPFDVRAGYALIPNFEQRLRAAGFSTIEQARFSPELERVAKWGILPPYAEPTSTKLTIHGVDGQPLFQAPVEGQYFDSFEEIPPLVVKGLLLIENRELDDPADSRTNPVVDWDRLAKAALLYTGHKLGLPLSVEGGSTLATQMEKYRHSYDGRTNSILSKLRQMTDASLKVYQNGPDTREERRQIILDYLNSIPLAAAEGYGELHGVGDGLNAWFDMKLDAAQKYLASPDSSPEKMKAFKNMFALLCSVKAPSYYLVQNRSALQTRANFYIQLLANVQMISQDFAKRVIATPLEFSTHPPKYALPSYAERKSINEIRAKLSSLLGIPGLYELDRLHLDVESTINPELQHGVISLFEKLHDAKFVEDAGLKGKRLLDTGDPAKVVYGMMLFEKTPMGNQLRIVTDNLNAPFDINTGMKMQLGSTAKLRTLVNYLNIVATLHDQLSAMGAEELRNQAGSVRDPISRWAADTMATKPDLDAFLQLALDRKYSGNNGESFFTGGGIHTFQNFEKAENGQIYTVREATALSVNLAYIRLMRDLVRFYQARLPYDTDAILSDTENPMRHKLLQEIADEESKHLLYQSYKSFQKNTPEEIVRRLLGKKVDSDRHLAILFYAWNHGGDEDGLTAWMQKYLKDIKPEKISKLLKAYGNPRLNLSDYGYLLGIHPLRVWCAGELAQDPSLTWDQVWNDSSEARQIAATWLFKTRNRSAQDLRLRIRIEQDAFSRMTPQWKRLGFPFDRLVPSYATAIGSSGDRPEALAQLMGILVNDGVMKPTIRMSRLRFASRTPYETAMGPAQAEGTRVIPQAVARAILPVLAEVVQHGTAVRLANAYKVDGRPLIVGGKTGSGDNRFDTFGRGGGVIASRSIDRTATFVFYIEDRFFGVITVFVPGKEAADYSFTSSLPVAILKLLKPEIEKLWPQPNNTTPGKPVMLVSNKPADPNSSTQGTAKKDQAASAKPAALIEEAGAPRPAPRTVKAVQAEPVYHSPVLDEGNLVNTGAPTPPSPKPKE